MSRRFLGMLEPLRTTFTPRIVIQDLNSSMPDMYGISTLLELDILVVQKGSFEDKVVRFFKIPKPDGHFDLQPVVSDFERLLRQTGGATKFGYVLRDGVPEGSVFSFDLYSPELTEKRQQIGH